MVKQIITNKTLSKHKGLAQKNYLVCNTIIHSLSKKSII